MQDQPHQSANHPCPEPPLRLRSYVRSGRPRKTESFADPAKSAKRSRLDIPLLLVGNPSDICLIRSVRYLVKSVGIRFHDRAV
jgi:hypothetical protein